MEELARKVVAVVLDDLDDRSGFDGWWDSIDQETKQELRSELVEAVVGVLQKEKP